MNVPDIIKSPYATISELHNAGIFVYQQDGSRQYVGHMSNNTLRHVAHKIADEAMDKEAEIANGYSILGSVRGEMAYDMLESEIERAGNGEMFRQLVEGHPLWYHLVSEYKRRGLTFPYYRI